MTAELNIPDAVQRAFLDAKWVAEREGYGGTSYVAGLAAAAPLIVAAELRRLDADNRHVEHDSGEYQDGMVCVCDELLRRADELDPQGGESCQLHG